MDVQHLSSYQHCVSRICDGWPAFRRARTERLEQQRRHGHAAEKVAENILEDLFTQVLDWELNDLNNQVQYADLLLSRLGVKYLLVETKRPGALAWNRRAVDAALQQACAYADEQRVGTVAVSDGIMLYAADRIHGGLHDRLFVNLADVDAPATLWWLSVHGIYRPRADAPEARMLLLAEQSAADPATPPVATEGLLHPKYHLPAQCFAYVGHESDPTTWHLPYRSADGRPDLARLPKAIQAIISNYRGTKVKTIPEAAIPDVLHRLAAAAIEIGKMPPTNPSPAAVYAQLAAVLEQLGAGT
ncbi:MAG: hypothetical protein ACRD1V_07725 [Vicinamibacterales bacterium]